MVYGFPAGTQGVTRVAALVVASKPSSVTGRFPGG